MSWLRRRTVDGRRDRPSRSYPLGRFPKWREMRHSWKPLMAYFELVNIFDYLARTDLSMYIYLVILGDAMLITRKLLPVYQADRSTMHRSGGPQQ